MLGCDLDFSEVKRVMNDEDLVIIYDVVQKDTFEVIMQLKKKFPSIEIVHLKNLINGDYILKRPFILFNYDHANTAIRLFLEKNIDSFNFKHFYYAVRFRNKLINTRVDIANYDFKNFIRVEEYIPFSFHSTALERYFLYSLVKNRKTFNGNIAEIGSFNGGTSIALSLGIKHNKISKTNLIAVCRRYEF